MAPDLRSPWLRKFAVEFMDSPLNRHFLLMPIYEGDIEEPTIVRSLGAIGERIR